MPKKQKEALMKLSRAEMLRAGKVLKIKNMGNKNKTQMVTMIMEAIPKMSQSEYDANSTILMIRELLGLSTRTQKIRKSSKPAKQQADEAMADMKKAMKPRRRTKKQKESINTDMEKFEEEITNITSYVPIDVQRRMRRNNYIDSAGMMVSL
jgi:hypothetical protein